MKINENQIRKLIDIANDALNHKCYKYTGYHREIKELLSQIENIQLEEFRDVKMNDFTKEELLIIWLSVPGNSYYDLKIKIESMIDNYCDHESNYYEPITIKCIKCGKELA